VRRGCDVSSRFAAVEPRPGPNWNRAWIESLVEGPPSAREAAWFVDCRLIRVMWRRGITGAFPAYALRVAEKVAADALDLYLALHGLPRGHYTIRREFYGHGWVSLSVEGT
jgi:hypothetical protein